ncbi:MAG TPA: DUF4345 family protein [Rubricoccaceae bacterium]|nr:DUF4345 family protein [Rubricoccaceae bacterium]
MRMAPLSLGLAALAFAGFGAWLLVDPAALSVLGIELTRPTATTEIRAFYGGLELGLAAFFARAATRVEWFRPALLAQALALGGIVLGRVVGFVVDGSAAPLILAFAALEAAGAVLAALALRQLTG